MFYQKKIEVIEIFGDPYVSGWRGNLAVTMTEECLAGTGKLDNSNSQ